MGPCETRTGPGETRTYIYSQARPQHIQKSSGGAPEARKGVKSELDRTAVRSHSQNETAPAGEAPEPFKSLRIIVLEGKLRRDLQPPGTTAPQEWIANPDVSRSR